MLMEHEIDVYGPPTATRDGGGGTLLTWPTVRTSGVACLLRVSASGPEDRFAQKQLTDSVTLATFDTSTQRGDKIVVTAGPTEVGTNLLVTNIPGQPGVDALGFDTLVHITCQRLQ